MQNIYNVISIIRGTTVDGPGFRTSIYLAGCTHACPGCHNPQSWPFDAGEPMTIDEIMDIVHEEDFDVTLSGGDPLCSPASTFQLVKALKRDGRDIWLYTGFTWEEIIATRYESSDSNTNFDKKSIIDERSIACGKKPDPSLFDVISNVDVVVEGPFIMSKRDPDLLFRGSSNQRLIDVKATLSSPLQQPVLFS